MQAGPRLRAIDLTQAFALDPTEQAFNACMTFHVGSSILGASLLRLVVVTFQAVVKFQPLAKLTQGFVVVVGRVYRVTGGVNLVDGDMNVQVVGVVVHRTDSLMLTVPEALTDARLDGFQCGFAWFFGPETDDQVIGLVGFGTSVLDLGVDDLDDGCVRAV